MPIPTIVSGAAFCIECMRANGMPHKEDCSRGEAQVIAAVIEHHNANEATAISGALADFPVISIESTAPALDDLAIVQEQLAHMAIDPTESMVIEKGRDGAPWRFFGSKRGDMIEVARVLPDGSVQIAPHASIADLHGAIEVLGRALHEAQRIPGTEPAEFSVDVVIH